MTVSRIVFVFLLCQSLTFFEARRHDGGDVDGGDVMLRSHATDLLLSPSLSIAQHSYILKCDGDGDWN